MVIARSRARARALVSGPVCRDTARVRVLPFEDADPSLIPMAGRRALDRAGQKLSLRAWQGMSLMQREMLASLGEQDEVDVERVAALLEGVHPAPEPIGPLEDPQTDAVPPDLRAALGERALTDEAWRSLDPLARYVLANYARRGRAEKLALAYDSLVRRTS